MIKADSVVDEVIRSRKAVRAFLAAPVSRALVSEILDVARYAPSNSNTQPWFVHVLEGEPKRLLSEALLRSHEANALPPSRHFPDDLPAACRARQSEFGARYYAALGIDRADVRHATGRPGATTRSSMRPSDFCSRSKRGWAGTAGSTSACSFKA